MNKKQLFQQMWIDINKRIPPDKEEEILIWLPKQNLGPFLRNASDARKDAEKLLKYPSSIKELPPARIFSMWMPLFPPTVYEKTWEQHKKMKERQDNDGLPF